MSSHMEMEFISRENIKPASPTPHHLRTHNLSLLDQIMPPIHHPPLMYFPAHDPNKYSSNIDAEFVSQRTQLLKHSLSSCLTRYHPFAGTITGNLSVECNDEGVPFVVAKFKTCTISDFLQQPDLFVKQRFLQEEIFRAEGGNVRIVQVNIFDCGGVAIAVNLLHSVADAATLFTFLKDWALFAAQQEEIISPPPPVYMGHSVFPQISNLPEERKLSSGAKDFIRMAKFIPRRCVFNALAISKLKAKSSSSKVESPSSVEAVSALIWKCFMAAQVSIGDQTPTSSLIHAVNLRRRTVPPLPANCFGNFLWTAPATHPSEEENDETELTTLVSKIRESTTKINVEFIKNMQYCQEEGGACLGYYENLEKTLKRTPKEAEILNISSWCKFGIYDIDFGWGRPIWVSNYVLSDSESPMMNSVALKDTRSGDGIEALVILEEKYVAAFENNEELLTFASVDLSLI